MPALQASVRFLWHEVTVRCDDHDLISPFDRGAPDREHDFEPAVVTTMSIRRRPRGELVVFDGPDEVAVVLTRDGARAVVEERIERRAGELAALRGWVHLRGAVLPVSAPVIMGIDVPAGARALMVDSGGGTHSLSTSFLSDGNRNVVFPSFSGDGEDGSPAWSPPISTRPTALIVVVEFRGGPSLLAPIASIEAVRWLVEAADASSMHPREILNRISALVGRTPALRLRASSPDLAVDRIQRLLSEGEPG